MAAQIAMQIQVHACMHVLKYKASQWKAFKINWGLLLCPFPRNAQLQKYSTLCPPGLLDGITHIQTHEPLNLLLFSQSIKAVLLASQVALIP
jgi:hypothetical protein